MHAGGDFEDDFVPDTSYPLDNDNGDHDDVENAPFFSETEDVAALPTAKKRKRREKEKERRAKKRKLGDAVDPIVKSVADQPPDGLAVYLASMQAMSFPDLSEIELGDIGIPGSSIANTTAWASPRTLDQLVLFIKKMLPTLHTRLSQKSKSNGAPTLLFLSGAALRVADVTRVLRNKALRGDKGGEVAKLFAKHFKLSEHVTYLKRTKVGAAVGTPGRIGKLLCETDVSYMDAKKRTLLDIPETRDEVFRTVFGASQVTKAIKEGKIQVVLF